MAITVNSRPIKSSCNWNAAGNPIIYKLTTDQQAKTDFKLWVDFKRGVAPNDSLLNDVPLYFSCDANGLIYIDASILKNLLTPDWSLPASVNEEEETTYISFYLSYQEFYDGELQGSVTNDSSNVIFALFSANQIGDTNGSNMLAYLPSDSDSKWLTKFQLSDDLKKTKMWRDWPFTLSLIWPTGVSDIDLACIEKDASGEVLNGFLQTLSNFEDKVTRIDPLNGQTLDVDTKYLDLSLINGNTEYVQAPTFASSTGWNVGSGAGSWTIGGGMASVTLLSGADSDPLIGTLSTEQAGVKLIRVIGTVEVDIGNVSGIATITLYKDSVAQFTYQKTFSLSLSIGGATDADIGLPYQIINDVNGIDQVGIVIQTTASPGHQATVEIYDVNIIQISTLASRLDVEVCEVCENDGSTPIIGRNPIQLFWKNSLGGDSWWNFPLYHEYSYNYQNSRKAKRIILFATDLHPVQWEALNELNTIGEVYSPPIIDLENTNTTVATSKRVGQQVYIVSQDGATKTGVIVIPSSSTGFGRDTTDSISIEIELPQVFGLE